MKQRFKSKPIKKKSKKFKSIFYVSLFLFSIYQTFQYLLKSSIKIDDKLLVQFMLDDLDKKNYNALDELISTIKDNYSPTKLLMMNYYNLLVEKETTTAYKESSKEYLIYIYNTHQTEEYAANTFLEQQVNPTVMMASYIMEDVFDKNGYKTLVEERKIKDILNQNNWKYYKSYDASRIYLNDSKEKNPTLKYFIDVHRDSLTKEKTTVTINDKSYAKIIFLLGLENPNYQENLDFMTKINDMMNEKYPNLSKGIYQKEGSGVNGVYNQDNSKYTILVEIGGTDNTTDEVLNSTLAFTDCFMEVISNNEG